jgi:hypothetical protein
MGKGLILGLMGLSAVLILAAPAAAGRHCRYEGRIFNQGDLVCISLAGKTRLARCGMMLNNATWNFLQDGCPTAALTPLPRARPSGDPAPEPIVSSN